MAINVTIAEGYIHFLLGFPTLCMRFVPSSPGPCFSSPNSATRSYNTAHRGKTPLQDFAKCQEVLSPLLIAHIQAYNHVDLPDLECLPPYLTAN
jgi:hypothetical protein